MQKDICYSFNWFDNQLKNAVLTASKTFWETNFIIKTESLTTNFSVKNDFASKGEVYFTAQLSVCPHQNCFIRLSSEFIRILFHECLGSSSPFFKLQDLSELEIKILNSFCDFLNSAFKILTIPHDKIPKEQLKNKDVYNATFLIGKNSSKFGKMVVSLPQNCLKIEKIKLQENFSFENFLDVSTYVNILAGSSKLSLNDLKNLYPGDIILLENSSINLMKIKTFNITKSFKVNPDSSLMLELNEDEEEELGAQMVENQNIWDDIQIEVGAEFDKIKMTLGDLKQISKGLVIDLGPIFENKISLFVEDKVVAKGELVIINDKYGVKIDEIISTGQQKEELSEASKEGTVQKGQKTEIQNQKEKKPLPPPTDKNIQNPAPKAVLEDAEEFDYSDFENDK